MTVRRLSCPVCGARVFFDDVTCVTCGTRLAFDPAADAMTDAAGAPGCAATAAAGTATGCTCPGPTSAWRAHLTGPREQRRPRPDHVPVGEAPGDPAAEPAGHRRRGDRTAAAVRAAAVDHRTAQVTTGHADGLVTLDIAEGHPSQLEQVRTSLAEAYRAPVGHVRHEIGHWHWQASVAGDARAPRGLPGAVR